MAIQKRKDFICQCLSLILLLTMFILTPAFAQTNKAIIINVDESISPAAQDYIQRGIVKANEEQAKLIIIRLDTPGGLGSSMRLIIKDILSSAIPIVTYVAPDGARAASAGTFIMLASPIAAMAPGTNIGAASPVSLGQDDNKKTKTVSIANQKAINDAAAFIRGLAVMHKRNATWAEQAVREGVSLPAFEALKMQVIDIVANNIPDLLQQINGRFILVQDKWQPLTIDPKLNIETFHPDWRHNILSVIANPNIAYILILLAMYGLFFELVNPGFVLPGVVGGIALLLALYALQLLPINYTGFGLILLGIIFMATEAVMPSFGALGIGGVIAFIIGSILLLDFTGNIPWFLIGTMVIINIAFFALIGRLVLKSRKRKIVSGYEGYIGEIVTVQEDFANTGWVKFHGDWWQAKTDIPLKVGEKARIKKLEGLVLFIEPLHSSKTNMSLQ